MKKSLMDQIESMSSRLLKLEDRVKESNQVIKDTVLSEFSKRKKYAVSPRDYFGIYLALCVDTQDPLKQNRVRYYSPFLELETTRVDQLDWAWPCSSMGGFDDSGLNWVPPAGSLLVIMFERGDRLSAYYLGTTWSRSRGDGFGYPVEEYDKISKGHRTGYLVGKDDESQVLPPWNTESYNGIDVDMSDNKVPDSDAIDQKYTTYPNIYGFKTPQKHMLKMVDGDAKCNYRHKRIELKSNFNWMLFKDDMLHPGGQWANPECNCDSSGDVSKCVDENGVPLEKEDCMSPKSQPKCANPYYKQRSECRPYGGPGTPQNNKCALDQGGIQFLDMAGNSMIFDSSVDQPRLINGVPWERGMSPFDFGCTDLYTGKIKIISATGHRIEMDDSEDTSQYRGSNNGIRLITATGNYAVLCDATNENGLATEKRGVWVGSTSGHKLIMCDDENEQTSPTRMEIVKPGSESNEAVDPFIRQSPNAKKAYVRLRTGYGLDFLMSDDYNQQKTMQQHIQILSPQVDNKDRGPHVMRFQETPTGPGQVSLRVGGTYICSTYDDHQTFVGVEKNPSNKFTGVTGWTYINTKKEYFNVAHLHEFISDTVIWLLAGKDCPMKDTPELGPCPFPVLVYQPQKDAAGKDLPGRIAISDRVFASASPKATVANIFSLYPFQY
jgi:hypothetical protein